MLGPNLLTWSSERNSNGWLKQSENAASKKYERVCEHLIHHDSNLINVTLLVVVVSLYCFRWLVELSQVAIRC